MFVHSLRLDYISKFLTDLVVGFLSKAVFSRYLALKDTKTVSKIQEIPYEKKYMEKYNRMSNEIIYTEEENLSIIEKELELKREFKEAMEKIDNTLAELKKELDAKEVNRHFLEEDPDKDLEWNILEHKEKLTQLEKKRTVLLTDEYFQDQAKLFVLGKRLKKLKQSILIEKTPLGNVIMFYDYDKESFGYYSDFTVPYRYLETVSRKYVTMFHCKYIYVDMTEVLKEAELKADKIKEDKEREKEKEKERLKNAESQPKKNVFAKLKTYNKGSLKTAAAPSKNSAPAKNQLDENVVIKENSNRYTCEGRFLDYKPLQKVDKKIVDKRLGLSFADFKRMQQQS